MSPEEVHAKVIATRAAQGLPPTIQDPATLERIAAILRLCPPATGAGAGRTAPRPARRRKAATGSGRATSA
ncbi:MAG: hypothetical protein ACRDSP_26855 [Pseudonocardiaceae bacterium]